MKLVALSLYSKQSMTTTFKPKFQKSDEIVPKSIDSPLVASSLFSSTVVVKMEPNYIIREPDEKRQRKRTSLDPVTCPVCSVTIRENELDHHFRSELEKLHKIKKIVNKSPSTSPGTSKIKHGEGTSTSKNEAEENCWETYQKIKENRVRRSSKVREKENFYVSACILKSVINSSLKIVKGKLRIGPAPFAAR